MLLAYKFKALIVTLVYTPNILTILSSFTAGTFFLRDTRTAAVTEIEMDFYFDKKLMMQLFTSFLFVKR